MSQVLAALLMKIADSAFDLNDLLEQATFLYDNVVRRFGELQEDRAKVVAAAAAVVPTGDFLPALAAATSSAAAPSSPAAEPVEEPVEELVELEEELEELEEELEVLEEELPTENRVQAELDRQQGRMKLLMCEARQCTDRCWCGACKGLTNAQVWRPPPPHARTPPPVTPAGWQAAAYYHRQRNLHHFFTSAAKKRKRTGIERYLQQ
jgi:hypothetical protein